MAKEEYLPTKESVDRAQEMLKNSASYVAVIKSFEQTVSESVLADGGADTSVVGDKISVDNLNSILGAALDSENEKREKSSLPPIEMSYVNCEKLAQMSLKDFLNKVKNALKLLGDED